MRKHPELQKACLTASSDHLMLALEKEREKDRRMKQCCSSCSIRQEDDVEMMVAPDVEDRGIEGLSVSETGGAQGGEGQSGRSKELLSSSMVGWTWGNRK